jgi:serine O-acetyltransferase
MPADLEVVRKLAAARRSPSFPAQTRQLAREIGRRTLTLLFPEFADRLATTDHEIELEILELRGRIIGFLDLLPGVAGTLAEAKADAFVSAFIELRDTLQEDAEAIFHADPAADSADEVILSYPGFLATAYYRIAHRLRTLGVPLLPRLLAQEAQHQTGIDINPGAIIGRRFSIDHGVGVVIGETCQIGHGVKLFQGVTLGALAVDRTLRETKRHPTIEDNVVIYANATILGGETVIGHDSVVGGNAWITSSVPPFSMVNRQSTVRPRTSSESDLLEFMI